MAHEHDVRDTLPDDTAFEQFDTLPGVVWVFCRSCGLVCKPANRGEVPFCQECMNAARVDPLSDEYGTLGGGD